MNLAARTRLAGLNRSQTGGWFCYGSCQAWTELNMEREQNVCVMCGRPTVRLMPPAGFTGRRPALASRPVDEERAVELFQRLRAAVS